MGKLGGFFGGLGQGMANAGDNLMKYAFEKDLYEEKNKMTPEEIEMQSLKKALMMARINKLGQGGGGGGTKEFDPMKYLPLLFGGTSGDVEQGGEEVRDIETAFTGLPPNATFDQAAAAWVSKGGNLKELETLLSKPEEGDTEQINNYYKQYESIYPFYSKTKKPKLKKSADQRMQETVLLLQKLNQLMNGGDPSTVDQTTFGDKKVIKIE